MKLRLFTAAIAASIAFAGAAGAVTLNGLFNVQVAQITNVNSSELEATAANFSNAITTGVFDVFTYNGALDFGTFNSDDSTTVASWLATGTPGGVSGLDSTIGDLQLSKPNINANPGSATTTFFLFTLATLNAADFSITHDDGIALFDDGLRIGGFNGPNGKRTTAVSGFDGGQFDLLYVATNGDPSILKVDMTPVPVPASLPLLLAGLGGFALLRRRARA